MEAMRRRITSFAEIETVIDELCAVAHARNRETDRRALKTSPSSAPVLERMNSARRSPLRVSASVRPDDPFQPALATAPPLAVH
jgi:hypothetical protein